MKQLVSRIVVLCGALLFGVVPARATIIFDAGPPSTADSSMILSDFDASSSGSGVENQVGSFFILDPGSSVITDIHWWGIYGHPDGQLPIVGDNFTVRIFNWDQQNNVALNPFYENNVGNNVNRTDSTLDVSIAGVGPYDIYSYWIDIDPVALLPDTYYLLSILNDTTGQSYSWSWSRSGTNEGVTVSSSRGAIGSPEGLPWTNFGGDMAFHLTAVPEPGMIALLSLGLAGLGFARRKMKP